MGLAENFISYIVEQVLAKRAAELKTIDRDAAKLEAIRPPFPRLRYDEAVEDAERRACEGRDWSRRSSTATISGRRMRRIFRRNSIGR